MAAFIVIRTVDRVRKLDEATKGACYAANEMPSLVTAKGDKDTPYLRKLEQAPAVFVV